MCARIAWKLIFISTLSGRVGSHQIKFTNCVMYDIGLHTHIHTHTAGFAVNILEIPVLLQGIEKEPFTPTPDWLIHTKPNPIKI